MCVDISPSRMGLSSKEYNTCMREKYNTHTVEKADRHHLNLVIKVNIINYKIKLTVYIHDMIVEDHTLYI